MLYTAFEKQIQCVVQKTKQIASFVNINKVVCVWPTLEIPRVNKKNMEKVKCVPNKTSYNIFMNIYITLNEGI